MPWEGSPDSMTRKSGDRPSSCRFKSTSEGSVDDDSSKGLKPLAILAKDRFTKLNASSVLLNEETGKNRHPRARRSTQRQESLGARARLTI